MPPESTNINITASKDPSHKDFHINFGKILATALLGLSVYAETQKEGSSAGTVLENPQNLLNIVSGFSAIWTAQPPQ